MYQRPARGGRPPGNPRGTNGLGRGFAAKICPKVRGISQSAFAFLAKLPGDLPTGFANALLSRGPAPIIPWRGKTPGDPPTGFAHRLLSRCSAVNSSGERSTAFRSLRFLSSLRTADVFPVVASLFRRERSEDRKYVCCSQATF